jgi:hypothetical protein
VAGEVGRHRPDRCSATLHDHVDGGRPPDELGREQEDEQTRSEEDPKDLEA